MSPLRRHSFAFMAKWGFFGPSSVKRGRTHIVLGWNMSGASTSTYLENLGSGGLIPAELRGRVCLFFCFFCPSRYDARHRNPRRYAYTHWSWGERALAPRTVLVLVLVFVFVLVLVLQQAATYSIAANSSRQLNHSSCICYYCTTLFL